MGRKLVKKEEGAHSVDPQVALFFTGCFIKIYNDGLNISTIGSKSYGVTFQFIFTGVGV